ncbi:MAG TPA: peptidase M16, partial [Brevundimonas sp.]|nr:peptidase M16 [Brevundimonas sp.]
FTSRINMNLREDKGWSYGAGSGIRTTPGERLFLVSTGVQADRTADSLVEIDNELTGIVDGRPVTDQELGAHKANLIQGMAGDWETNASVAGDLVQMVVYSLPEDYYDQRTAGLAATTPASVSAAARDVLGDGPTVWVIVGDRAAIEPKIRELGLGEVRVVDINGDPVE